MQLSFVNAKPERCKYMADNYLENKMEALREREAKEAKARNAAWKKRLDAYRKKLAQQQAAAEGDKMQK